MRDRLGRGALAAGICLVVAAVAWHWRIVSPVHLPGAIDRWNGDLYTIYVPLYSWAYRAGVLAPNWNPHQLAGMPGVGGYNGGLLYPVHWLAAVLPVAQALGWSCVIHLALAAMGVLACGRGLGLGWAASSVAAVTFAGSDLFFAAHVHPSYLAGHAWVPFMAWSAGRLVAAPSLGRGALLGSMTAAQFLTGHPQIVWYTVLGITLGASLYVLVDDRARRSAHLAALAGAVLVAVLVAAGVSAAQMLPTIEVLAHAARAHLTLGQTMAWEPSWASLRLVLGVGPGLLLVAVAALDRSRARAVMIGIVLAGSTILVAIGWGPARDLFYSMPMGDRFRLPFRIAFVGQLALALAAGAGLEVLRRATPNDYVVAFGMAIAGAVACVALGSVSATWGIAAVVGMAAAMAATADARVRSVMAWVVVAIVLVERVRASPNNLMIPQHNPPSFFAAPEPFRWVAAHAGPERVLVVKDWSRRLPFMEKAGSMWGFHGVQDYEPLAPAAYPAWFAPLASANTDEPLFWGRLSPPPDALGWRMLDLLGTRWVVAPRSGAWAMPPADRFRLAHTDAVGAVYENLAAIPRARLASTFQVMDDERARRWIGGKAFDPAHDVMLDRAPTWGPDGPAAAADVVAWREDGADRIALDVAAAARRVLVLADLDWPGWRVTVDGEPRPLLRANALVRAVAIEPGHHRVTFVYDPWQVRIGRAISLATLLGMGVALLAKRRAVIPA